MPNYKEMYYIMVRAAEEAIRILAHAQPQCEELYISEDAPCVYLHPNPEVPEKP